MRPLSVPDIFRTLKGSRKVAALCNGDIKKNKRCTQLLQITYMGATGGSSTETKTRRILSALLDQDLSLEFIWTDKGQKRAFSTLTLNNVNK